jgi:hypothetical protein
VCLTFVGCWGRQVQYKLCKKLSKARSLAVDSETRVLIHLFYPDSEPEVRYMSANGANCCFVQYMYSLGHCSSPPNDKVLKIRPGLYVMLIHLSYPDSEPEVPLGPATLLVHSHLSDLVLHTKALQP